MYIPEVKQKTQKELFFLNNCIWENSCNFSILQKEYLWLAVNMLANSANNSDISRRDTFQLYLRQSDKKIW